MSFEEVVRWLDDRLSRPVAVSVAGPPTNPGNSGLTVRGALGRGSGEVGLIDPRSGTVADWRVGREARLHLLEGDLERAEVLDEVLWIETRELQINVSVED